MNLFARILSHGFALVVVALLALGLIYRGELFPEWELPEFLSLGHKPAAVTAQPEQVTPPPVAAEVATGETSAPETAASAPAEPLASEAAATAVTGLAEMHEAQPGGTGTEEAAGTAGVVETPATAEGGSEATPGTVPEQVTPAARETAAAEAVTEDMTGGEPPQPEMTASETAPAASVDTGEPAPSAESAPVTVHKAAAVTPYQLLAAAREAYWLRDYAVAEQKYQELIALDPDNPDGYGELGNMYFSQGDWDKASGSYYEAGTRLVAEGMLDRARQLVEVIRGLNGSQADDLEQRIAAAESATP